MPSSDNPPVRVAIASDHAGLVLKEEVRAWLDRNGFELQDMGTNGLDAVDYPDFAASVARSVVSGQADFGILVCGTGIGMAITANKFPGIRAAVCLNEFMAKAARSHNNANILALGARTTATDIALQTVEAFLKTGFEGGRHERRVAKISAIEKEALK